jgi:hypothetical protein
MIMMMTDPDRVALSAFLPAFLFRFIHPFMPTSTPTFHRNAPPAICHILLPRPILVFPFTSQQICSFSSHFSSTFWHACQTLHYFSRLLFAQHLSAGLLPSLQVADKHPKKLASRVTSRAPPLILCKPARVHAPTFDYLCIYYPWRYLSRTKKKNLLGK